jgi:hypothetical protein
MSYEEKYKKYKNKYLKLKELSGGGEKWVDNVNYRYDDKSKLLVIIKSDNNTITKENTNDMKVTLGFATNYLTDIYKAKDKHNEEAEPIKKEINLIIDESIERIEDYAFYDMKIKDVQFNNLNNTESQLKYIGKNAFANNKITNLNLPSNIQEIGDSAFANNDINTFNNDIYNFFYTIKWGNNVFINNKLDIELITENILKNINNDKNKNHIKIILNKTIKSSIENIKNNVIKLKPINL